MMGFMAAILDLKEFVISFTKISNFRENEKVIFSFENMTF
ncbi:MAG: hypothetical protein ACI97N_000949 [Cognaticolwellia sp.]|jgi:hypothetical protein